MALSELYPRDRSWHPSAYSPDYKTSVARSPRNALLSLETSASEATGPTFGHGDIDPLDNDLLRNYAKEGEPIGERIIVHGRVLDENARAVPNTLVEIWQANAGGRYRHKKDTYLAPINPNFGGCGRTLSDGTGHYAFRTVKPGAYPWRNRVNNWRPAHIHVSVFGTAFAQRLVTQMYFEGDPLIARCPIVNTIPDPRAIDQLVAALDLNASVPLESIAYKFDIVLRGHRSTFFREPPGGELSMVQSLHYLKETASQTAGPYVHIGLAPGDAGFDIYRRELGRDIAGPHAQGTRITVTGIVTDGTGAPVKDVLIEVWQANAAGLYPGRGEVEDGFRDWGRVIPDFESGLFSFETVKPGCVTGRNGRMMAPHLNLWLVARGINVGLNTRMYFGDEHAANAADPVMNLIEQAHRRDTLVARADGARYRFDIRLQGDGETVFFDV